jgi:Uncharacterised nucleotidyltransferase
MFETLPRAGSQRFANLPVYLLPVLDALRFRGSSTHALKQLDDKEWEALLSFCDRAHLTLLLSDLPTDVAPEWVQARIRKNILDNSLRQVTIRGIYRMLAQALAGEQLEHIVIKGFTQYPEFVRDSNLRLQSDIDIYLPPESLLAARDVIMKMGYIERALPPNMPVDHTATLVMETKWRWNGNYYDPEMPPSIELHFCLWNKEAARFDIKGCDRFWDRRVTRNVDGFRFVSLHPADHLAFLSFHILRGLLRIDWIVHHVYELAFFLHNHARDHDFWESWRQLNGEEVRSLQAVAFVLAKVWFDCEVSDEVERSILRLSPGIQQWLLYFSASPLESMFTPNHDSVWLHASLVGSFAARVGVVRRALLPNRISPIKAANFPGSSKRTTDKTIRWVPLRYMAYVRDRLHHFSLVLSRGLWRGARWWLSQRQLGRLF